LFGVGCRGARGGPLLERIWRVLMARKTENASEQCDREPGPHVRYLKPRIMLIDLPGDVHRRLEDLGYNVASGTLGHPYRVPVSGDFVKVVADYALPAYEEQEIVVIDLSAPGTLPGPAGQLLVQEGKADLLAGSLGGVVDPRPAVMHFVKTDFDRIIAHGGCFLVFAAPRVEHKYLLVERNLYRSGDRQEEAAWDNWCLLSTLSSEHIQVSRRHGDEMAAISGEASVCATLGKHLGASSYECTLERKYNLSEDEWRPLAVNKYGETVSVALFPHTAKGFVLVLPQVADKAGLVIELVQEALPDLEPRLFPHVVGRRWVQQPQYELPGVLQLKKNKDAVTKRANERLAELDSAIDRERSEMGFLHDILTTSGEDLVKAVEQCLRFIGFKNLVNVDELLSQERGEVPRQEDLQILDQSPSLVIEIKGLAGLPTEADSFQVVKYVNRRMKEWERTDVQGLSIVNHQRNLPALERNHERAFTQQQVDDAEQSGVGLLTTWELFLLVRGMLEQDWDPSHLRSLFYRTGRIGRVPAHYERVGLVFNYWAKVAAVGIDVQESPLRLGDRVGFVLPGGFAEQVAESIQLDGTPVEAAEVGQKVGLQTPLDQGMLREGALVCVVRQEGEQIP